MVERQYGSGTAQNINDNVQSGIVTVNNTLVSDPRVPFGIWYSPA